MIPEGKLISNAYHVSLFLRIIISKHGQYFDLNLALLVQFFLVL